jgi:hypothetical protein
MRLQPWIASILVGLGVASCGENAPPANQSRADLSQAKDAGQPVAGGNRTARSAALRNDGPVPPIDAQWTILCDSVDGPAHVQDATILKSRLIQASGMPDWYIIHGEKDSTIYYGYYRSLDSAAEKLRAERDRAKISVLVDRLGNRLLRGGVLVSVAAPDPTTHPEWNLLNTPKSAYWTIEVATFSGDLKRKEAAVQAVRELRERGEPAYYYHGPSASSVCIGAWPRDAVLEQDNGTDKKGLGRDDAHTPNADQPLLVFTGKPPENLAPRVLEPGTNKPMAVMGMKLEIKNPDMLQKTVEFPDHFVNYELHAAQSKGQSFNDPSVLVVIPREATVTGSGDDWMLNVGAQPGEQPAVRPTPSAAGDNVLRSIGDK